MDVAFVDSDTGPPDVTVSFVIDTGNSTVNSLILLRTPQFEHFLDESERGVSVSYEGDPADTDREFLSHIRFSNDHVEVASTGNTYLLNLRRVDTKDLTAVIAVLRQMNFDDRFELVLDEQR